MASPAFRAASAWATVPSSGNGSVDVSKPTGTAENDLLVLVVLTGAATSVSTLTAPSGFVLGGQRGGNVYQSGAQWWWKVAGGSEPSTYSITETAAGATGTAAMLAWSGADTTSPIDVSVVDSTNESGVTTISLPSLTTTVADTTYVAVPFEHQARTVNISAAGSMTLRSNSGVTARSIAILDEAIASAGSVSGRTSTASATSDWNVLAFAIAPAGGGGGSSIAAISNFYSMLRSA